MITVLGDALLDVDVDARAERLAPDTAAPVLDETARSERPGGAALAALLAAREAEVTLVTAIPDDADGARLRELLAGHVRLVELPCRGATAVKTRLRSGAHVVARLDRGGAALNVLDLTGEAVDALYGADAVLVSDYGRGVTRCAAVTATLARRAPAVWDPHPRGAVPLGGVRVVTPNTAEAARVLGAPPAATVAEASRQARALVRHWGVRAVALTLGRRGAVLADGTEGAAAFPPPRVADGDSCGAGDRMASRLATALASGALLSEAVTAAVDAASAFVASGGVANLDGAAPVGGDGVEALLARVRARGGTVVATGGCFDLLHAGHLATLRAARALGDCLIVCLNSDDSVRRAKGDGRPLQSAADRRRVLEGLRAVDGVVVFDEDTPLRVLQRLRPDVWVKGGDYDAASLPETPLVRGWGGEVVTVPYLPGRSTTRLVGLARS
jgi:rfaE bifunctional protein nucleotidyltransferase chain/domain/rfaE bifunctional protein kinase chain/domain